MYNISYFKEKDDLEVYAFMKAHPFITLCGTNKNNEPEATHIPVLFEEREGCIFLLAHVMRKQTHTISFEHNNKVLAIFSGAHTYVSASWYETKNTASTWNYQAVHARGILRFMEEDQLYKLLVDLTEKFEQNPDSPAQVKHMDKNYMERNLKAIIGFEIEITSIEHVTKLSQNRDKKSYDTIMHQLNQQDAASQAIAAEMLKRKDKIFNS